MRTTIHATLLTCIAMATASLATGQSGTIPDTPAGRVLSSWLDAINSGDRARVERFDATHDGRANSVDRMMRLRAQSGGFDLVSVRKSLPAYVEFTLKERGSGREAVGMLEVSDATPPRIAASQILLAPPGAKLIGFDVDAATRDRVIAGVLSKLDAFYVYPETAKKMESAVRGRAERGEYASVSNGVQLAARLTTDLQEVSRDKHLRVTFSPVAPPPGGPGASGPPPPGNCGFAKAEKLAGNIGYIKVDGFADPASCRGAASGAIAAIDGVDAVIFDLRDNGGGSPPMVAFLTSYLFEKRTHLNDLWNRTTGQTEEFWTTEDVPGRKLTTQPVYVLTSQRTFSGAEEFSYNLKNLERATIVGETTGGGAHPVRPERIDERFLVMVPNGRAINPITKTSWEGTGVEPHVKVPAADALAKALELAGRR